MTVIIVGRIRSLLMLRVAQLRLTPFTSAATAAALMKRHRRTRQVIRGARLFNKLSERLQRITSLSPSFRRRTACVCDLGSGICVEWGRSVIRLLDGDSRPSPVRIIGRPLLMPLFFFSSSSTSSSSRCVCIYIFMNV